MEGVGAVKREILWHCGGGERRAPGEWEVRCETFRGKYSGRGEDGCPSWFLSDTPANKNAQSGSELLFTPSHHKNTILSCTTEEENALEYNIKKSHFEMNAESLDAHGIKGHVEQENGDPVARLYNDFGRSFFLIPISKWEDLT
ncbi:hypothetical protein LXL04_013315 [Taraxacum kok-saghyz]